MVYLKKKYSNNKLYGSIPNSWILSVVREKSMKVSEMYKI